MTQNTRTNTLHSRFVWKWAQEDDVHKNIDSGWRPVDPVNVTDSATSAMDLLLSFDAYDDVMVTVDCKVTTTNEPATAQVQYKLVPDPQETPA